MITCKILVNFKLLIIKMHIEGWFRAYFCLLSAITGQSNSTCSKLEQCEHGETSTCETGARPSEPGQTLSESMIKFWASVSFSILSKSIPVSAAFASNIPPFAGALRPPQDLAA